MRGLDTVLATLVAVSAIAGCESNVIGPGPLEARRCEPPPMLIAGAVPQPFGYPLLRDALAHAAGPMASALGSSREVNQLRQAIDLMARPDGAPNPDTACRLILLANQALNALPADAATLPDRDGILLVLMIAVGVIKVH